MITFMSGNFEDEGRGVTSRQQPAVGRPGLGRGVPVTMRFIKRDVMTSFASNRRVLLLLSVRAEGDGLAHKYVFMALASVALPQTVDDFGGVI